MSLLLILSGPSGAGKDALLTRMKELGVPFYYVVTSTTRPPRTGEKDGVEYTFVSESGFQDMLQRGDLIESAKVYGYWYGVPKHEVKQALDEGKDVVLKIDVQGAATIRNLLPGAVLVFLTLPSLEEYEKRLRQRKTESDTDLKVRLGRVNEELRSMLIFDYVVVNREDELDGAVDQIRAIVAAEKCRVNPRIVQFK
ncbi:MAG: guanylate kinase [Dehalococcoidia bacterium]|nr:guanylate kinase [Dehalococcoidia bacterium]